MEGGIVHALSVVADLIALEHISSATITCNCDSEDTHVFTVYMDKTTGMVVVMGPGDDDA